MADTLLPGDGTSAAAEEVRNVATPEMHSLLLDLVGASADANVVYGTHGAACSITCGRYLSRWRQGDHVVVRDGCPAHRTLDERAAAGDQVPAVCQAGYACMQLAKNDTEGYCTKCATTQVCTVGTLVFGAEKNMLAWNKCPPGHRCYNSGVDHQYAIGPDDTVADLSLQLQKMRDMDEAELLSEFVRPCPTGTMCYDNEAADCGEAARMPLRVGWTDVHAGSYCPEASPGLEFCPPGFFCRDTKTCVDACLYFRKGILLGCLLTTSCCRRCYPPRPVLLPLSESYPAHKAFTVPSRRRNRSSGAGAVRRGPRLFPDCICPSSLSSL